MTVSPVEKVNLVADLEEYPALYEGVPQTNTARQVNKRLMRKIGKGIKLSPEDWKWKNVYDSLAKKNRDDDDEDEEEGNTKQDAYLLLLDKIASMTENYEKRIAKIRDEHQKELADKNKRIDDLMLKHNEERDKDLVKLVGMIATASKEGASNANSHLSQALTATNSLNGTLLSTMQTQWQNVGNFSKKQFEELNKIIDQKEKEEPGFLDSFITEVILPNQDKIGNTVKGLLETYLPKK